MNLLWKKYTISFSLQTKDNKQFRYVFVDFEQKRNWYWFTNDNKMLEEKLKDCIQDIFENWINQNWIFEGEDTHRLIDDRKLNTVNSLINTWWNEEYQPALKKGKIRNIKITHLIR